MKTKKKVVGLLVALASVAAAYAVTVCEIADCKNTCVYRGATLCVMCHPLAHKVKTVAAQVERALAFGLCGWCVLRSFGLRHNQLAG